MSVEIRINKMCGNPVRDLFVYQAAEPLQYISLQMKEILILT